MAWETRKGKGRYYTRSTRVDGRVVREYLGTGAAAEIVAKMAEQERALREQRQEQDRQESAIWQQFEDIVAAYYRDGETALHQTLEAVGYHRHQRGEWRKRRRSNLMNEITPADRHLIVSRAVNGDRNAEPMALTIVRENPHLFQIGWGDPVSVVLDLVSNGSSVSREIIKQEMETQLRELLGDHATPLEKLLTERIVVCRLQVTHWERDYNNALAQGTMTLEQNAAKQKRIDQAHKRYLSAIKALSQVRRLQLPSVQLNIGEKQVNIGTVTQERSDEE